MPSEEGFTQAADRPGLRKANRNIDVRAAVLTLRLPKAPEHTPRKIDIKTS